jgi:hypothetical protein
MEVGSDVEVVAGETSGGGRGGGDAEPTQMYMGKEYGVSELLRNLTRAKRCWQQVWVKGARHC